MNAFSEYFLNRPVPTIAASTGVSATGTVVSFAEHTLPVIQWSAGAMAFASGIIGVAVGAWHLKEIMRKERVRDQREINR